MLRWYLEGAEIRSIERMEGVSATLIAYWIRKMGSLLREKDRVYKSARESKGYRDIIIRHYLARFNRKTKCYSKALDMILHSLWMLFYKNLLLSSFI